MDFGPKSCVVFMGHDPAVHEKAIVFSGLVTYIPFKPNTCGEKLRVLEATRGTPARVIHLPAPLRTLPSASTTSAMGPMNFRFLIARTVTVT